MKMLGYATVRICCLFRFSQVQALANMLGAAGCAIPSCGCVCRVALLPSGHEVYHASAFVAHAQPAACSGV